MKLYLLKGCPFAHRASFALREKALPFDSVFFEHSKRPPELEAAGSRAKSPTLFDGDARVFESSVVLEYLEDRYPEPPLLPRDALLRAQARMFQARVTDELVPKHNAIVSEVLFTTPRDDAKLAEAVRTFVRALEPFDRHFADRAFAVGDTFTLADITLYTLFPAAGALAGVEVPAELGHLQAFVECVAKRPSAEVPKPAA